MSKDETQNDKLTREDVAKMLGVSKITLWRYVRDNKFPAPKKGINNYSVYWNREDVEKFIKEASK